MEGNWLQPFRMKQGKRVLLSESTSFSSIGQQNYENFVYSLMKTKSGYVFCQNPKITQKTSYLYLNTDILSLKQLSGRPG